MSHFNTQGRYGQTDLRLPIMGPISGVPSCPHCWGLNNLRLPDLSDFTRPSYVGSSRIRQFYFSILGFWQFENFRGEVYYRNPYSPHYWYYQYTEHLSVVLCPYAAYILEQSYGLFLPFYETELYSYLYHGYVKHYRPKDTCLVRFSMKEFSKRTNNPNSEKNNGSHQHPPPPPGFSIINEATGGKPMDVDTQPLQTENCQPIQRNGRRQHQPPPGFFITNGATGGKPMDVDTYSHQTENCQPNQKQLYIGVPPSCPPFSSQPNLPSSVASSSVSAVSQIVPMLQKSSEDTCLTTALNNMNIGLERCKLGVDVSVIDVDLRRVVEKIESGYDALALARSQQKATPMEIAKEDAIALPQTSGNFGHADSPLIDLSSGKFAKHNQLTPEQNLNCHHSQTQSSDPDIVFREDSKSSERQQQIVSHSRERPDVAVTSTPVNEGTICFHSQTQNSNPVLVSYSRKEFDFCEKEKQNLSCTETPSHEEHDEANRSMSVNDSTKYLNPSIQSNQNSYSKNSDLSKKKHPTLNSTKSPSHLQAEVQNNNVPAEQTKEAKFITDSQGTTVTSTVDIAKQDTRSYLTPSSKQSPPVFTTQKPQAAEHEAQQQKRNLTISNKAEKAFAKLQEDRQKNYKNFTSLMPDVITGPNTRLSSVFDLDIMYQDEKRKGVLTGSALYAHWCKHRRKVLVQSEPGFGKTTLCYLMALQWSSVTSPEKERFKLCIICELSSLCLKMGLAEALLNECIDIIKDLGYSSDDVQKALEQNSGNIMLVLDGYDALPEHSQKSVVSFLRFSGVFANSYILVTTRPSFDIDFLKLFDIHVYIRGLSSNYLRKFLPQNLDTKFFKVFADQHLKYLSELSPYFTSFVADIIKEKAYNYEKGRSLYTLLDIMVQILFAQKADSNTSDHLQLLGRRFLNALVLNKFTFTETELKQDFGDNYQEFLKCNIFYRQTQDCSKLVVSSKILLVFFATMYLRNEWSKLEHDDERLKFLKKFLCYSCCRGDYVTTANGDLYFVGLLPEIVLKYGSDRSLKDSTIEMYYDVDRIEYTHAFDSVNLLSRIDNRKLGRFGFEEIPNDCSCHLATFDSFLNMLCFDDCSVEYYFYRNVNEEKDFMKVEVQGSTHQTLQAILKARKNGRIDRLYVDFAYQEITKMFDFVSSLLCKLEKGFELDAEIKETQLSNFMEVLVGQIMSSNSSRSATVSCSCDSYRKLNCSFSISCKPETKEKYLLISHESINLKPSFTKYSSRDLPKATEVIVYIFKDCEDVGSDIRITINVF